MNGILYFVLQYLYLYGKTQALSCPNYPQHDLSSSVDKDVNGNKPNEEASESTPKRIQSMKCDFSLPNPKKVINPYKRRIENYVETKPFGSICLKCTMCLAVAKEMDAIFKEIGNSHSNSSKQVETVKVLNEKLQSLCSFGFENHDLRKFKEYQMVTDEFQCSSHVRSKMDGRWTEKLREICSTYSYYMDVQYLLNEYLKGITAMDNYLCRVKRSNTRLKTLLIDVWTANYPRHLISRLNINTLQGTLESFEIAQVSILKIRPSSPITKKMF